MIEMAQSKIFYLWCILLLLVLVEAKTPPGIANNPSHVTCKNKKYKMCHNLVHVCPKFCPDSCHVDCVSCKPICGPGEDDDTGSSPSPLSPPNPSPPTPSTPPKPSPSTPSTPSPSPPTPSTPPKPSLPTPSTPSPSPLSPPKPSPPTPTTPSPSPSTPSPSSIPPTENGASRKRVKCKNKSYSQCYAQEHVCPINCPTSCTVDCVTCKPVCSCDYPGAVCQDPRFIGADGITFYFHGKKDDNFCLVTDPNLHINAHFIGKRNNNMKRDFTWIKSIGVLFDNHKLFIGARQTSTWDDSKDRLALSLDGEPIYLSDMEGSRWESTNTTPLVTITRSSLINDVIIEVEEKVKIMAKVVPITKEESRVHNYDISNDDCFAHLDLGFKFYSLSQNVEGVLGKTYRSEYVSRVKMGVTMPVVGGDKEYKTSNLFATDCLASIFKGVEDDENSIEELASLNCASGMSYETTGVVCKR